LKPTIYPNKQAFIFLQLLGRYQPHSAHSAPQWLTSQAAAGESSVLDMAQGTEQGNLPLCTFTATLVAAHLHTHTREAWRPFRHATSQVFWFHLTDLGESAQKSEVRAAQSPNLATQKLFEYNNASLVLQLHDLKFISVTLSLHLQGKVPCLPLLCLHTYHNRQITGTTLWLGFLLQILYNTVVLEVL